MDSDKGIKIIWGKEVRRDLFRISDFILELWGDGIVFRFRTDLKTSILRISQYPNAYPVIGGIGPIRRCLVSKHVVLYYFYHSGEIQILRIYPTRMKPLEFNEAD